MNISSSKNNMFMTSSKSSKKFLRSWISSSSDIVLILYLKVQLWSGKAVCELRSKALEKMPFCCLIKCSLTFYSCNTVKKECASCFVLLIFLCVPNCLVTSKFHTLRSLHLQERKRYPLLFIESLEQNTVIGTVG